MKVLQTDIESARETTRCLPPTVNYKSTPHLFLFLFSFITSHSSPHSLLRLSPNFRAKAHLTRPIS